jgi:Las17-binding protein actin regulator/Stage II sporulation protein E (SpoIIE)
VQLAFHPVLGGGSAGLQIGVEGVDLVMLVMNDRGFQHLLSSKFEFSGDASAAAGPVGRQASAGTDATLRELKYCNAGHLPPIMMRKNGAVSCLETSGTVVGLFDGATYDESTISMQPEISSLHSATASPNQRTNWANSARNG